MMHMLYLYEQCNCQSIDCDIVLSHTCNFSNENSFTDVPIHGYGTYTKYFISSGFWCDLNDIGLIG